MSKTFRISSNVRSTPRKFAFSLDYPLSQVVPASTGLREAQAPPSDVQHPWPREFRGHCSAMAHGARLAENLRSILVFWDMRQPAPRRGPSGQSHVHPAGVGRAKGRRARASVLDETDQARAGICSAKKGIRCSARRLCNFGCLAPACSNQNGQWRGQLPRPNARPTSP